MLTLNYTIEINATAEKVYTTMIDKKGYEQWTVPFSPSSSFEGSWEKGSKIYFTASNKEGEKEGMVAEIAENIPHKFISIRHKGIVKGNQEILEGPEVESWANALENYTFEEQNGGTKLSISLDVEEKYKKQFDEMWAKSLDKLKEICES